jgi:hypothetical protein
LPLGKNFEKLTQVGNERLKKYAIMLGPEENLIHIIFTLGQF